MRVLVNAWWANGRFGPLVFFVCGMNSGEIFKGVGDFFVSIVMFDVVA